MSKSFCYTRRVYKGPLVEEKVITSYEDVLSAIYQPYAFTQEPVPLDLLRKMTERCVALEADNDRLREALASRVRAANQHEDDVSWVSRVYPDHAWTPDDGILYPDWCRRIRAKWEAEHEDLRARLATAEAQVSKGLDYEHHSSCGHVWTMRHTACPQCFADLRARLATAVEEAYREGYVTFDTDPDDHSEVANAAWLQSSARKGVTP